MKLSVRQIVISGLMGAVSILLGVTRLGFIGPFPPLLLVSATILHIPAILGGVLEGPVVGLIVGLIFGIFSWLQAPTEQPPVNLWFSNPLVSVLPRLFIGVTSAYVYRACKRNESSALGVPAGWHLTEHGACRWDDASWVMRRCWSWPGRRINAVAEVIVAVIIVIAVIAAWKGSKVGAKVVSLTRRQTADRRIRLSLSSAVRGRPRRQHAAAIDIGNTNTKFGLFDGDRLRAHWRCHRPCRTLRRVRDPLINLFAAEHWRSAT
jgi:uncharacterized membrane protein